MAESMSGPWIRDYLMDVAETYGAQLYNAPVSTGKKKVQLIDFLTYQENSYVWAWISDKDHRVSVRISKDAVNQYKSIHGRNIVDCRFSLVFISQYRPMFSPRPLGPNATGNTPVSHISLEICHVKSVGIGGHLFGNPSDIESDDNMKEWVLGLRQDGGGGNVLKLRKQKELGQDRKVPPPPPPPLPPPPPPFPLHAPVSQRQAPKVAEDTAKPKPKDFKRAYAKRWRIIEVNPWKFATKPTTREQPNQTESSHPPIEPHLDTTNQLESHHHESLVSSPYRTPSPTSKLQRRGTPTEWSPSIRGSPLAPEEAPTIALGNGIRQHGEPEVLPTTPQLPSDTEAHTTVDTAIASDTHSLRPPTPAQRTKHSPPPRSTSLPPGPLEVFACSSPLSSQQLLFLSSPLPAPSLSLPPSSLPMPASIRKNIQRKVPHPGLPVPRPDPTKQGPVQILVPNSDTSGTGSSQSYSQSQHPSHSQRYQYQLLSHSPAFPSSLAKGSKPPDVSTPRGGKPGSPTRRTSKMSPESLVPIHRDVDEQKPASTYNEYSTEKVNTNMGKQEGTDSTRPRMPSAPKIEVLEIGASGTEEETDQLYLTHSTARTEVDFDTQTGTRDTGDGDAHADHEDDQLSVDKVGVHSAPQSSPPCRSPRLAATSVIQHPSPDEQDTDGIPIHHPAQTTERPGSWSSMHSLFSDLLEDEHTVLLHAPVTPASRTEDKVQGKARHAHVPSHDPEAWKEPTFIAKNKGKRKARVVKEQDTPSAKVGQKRRRSTQPESPVPKRVKVTAPELRRVTSGQTTTNQDIEASASGKMCSSNRPSTSPTETTETTTPPITLRLPKPRLANFVVDFERIDLGKRVPTPMVDMNKDIKCMLLRTGRIRTLGEEVEKDGSVYIIK